jgi:gamma-tubulin complex component 3
MYAAIQNWVVLGELDDPRSEFFVTSDPAVAEEDLWRHRYGVDDAMLPPFITREQAADVLRVGKSINFLRRCCDDDGWTAERAPVAAAAANAGGLGYGNPKALDALIAEAKRRIDRCLRRVLFERYKLFEHCFAVKRYLLLGQGDFHACLMDLAGEDLAEPASNVSAYKLSGTLESAIRASNAQYDESDVLDRLRVKMMPAAGADEVGWDVFSLEYQTSAPLTTVFTPDAMGKYLRVFTFLWRLKRVEHALCATWQTMKPNVTAALARDGVAGAAGVALAEELRRCHTLRGEMHHFIANMT